MVWAPREARRGRAHGLPGVAPLQRDDSGKLMNGRIVGLGVKQTPRDRFRRAQITFTQGQERHAQVRLMRVVSRTHRAPLIKSRQDHLIRLIMESQ